MGLKAEKREEKGGQERREGGGGREMGRGGVPPRGKAEAWASRPP